ncbi:cytochrome P450 [Microdochium bolleyi]|uniref:Cytochrome P450 n=1 Tax=Microdochium bolleyi TaxID=196109 RepID=A0A136IPV3_9PEZI|nr:cytochrome P450 [Microdochium bolleyi]
MASSLRLEDVLARILAVHPAYVLLGLTTAGLAALLRKLYTKRSKIRNLQAEGIPILTHSWISGHLPIVFDFYKSHPADTNAVELEAWLARNRKRYLPEHTDDSDLPPVIYLDLWPMASAPMAIICDVDMATQWLAAQPGHPAGVTKGPLITAGVAPLTDKKDLACMDGEEWKLWRGRLNPAFSSRNLSALLPDIIDEMTVFTQGLEKMAGSGREAESEGWGQPFPLWHRTSSLTLDVIGRALVGRRLHDQTSTDIGGCPTRVALLSTIDIGKELMTWPGWLSNFMSAGRKYPRALAKNHKTMDEFLDPVIYRALGLGDSFKSVAGEEPHEEERMRNMKTLVDVACEKDIPADLHSVKALSSTLKIMMFAGFDTTATALCWMFKELQDNPSCLATLRAEHDQILGALVDGVDPVASAAAAVRDSPHLLNNLPYTAAVIKETLRLHQPIIVLRHNHDAAPTAGFRLAYASTGQMYPTTGFAIQDGSSYIQRSPEHWPRPDEFLPERWLVSAEDKDHPLHPKYGGPTSDLFRGFGGGPRVCIGKELAIAELKLAAALIVRKFEIREAWEQWDALKGQVDAPKDTICGQRLYPTGPGAAQVKDDMPVQIRIHMGTWRTL